VRWALAAAAAIALACSVPPSADPPATSPPAGDPGPGPGSLAPDFSLTDLAGKTLTLSAYRGKVVLLDFWATWCPPCRAEMPHFVELQNTHGQAGLQILGVSIDDAEPPVREFVTKYGLNFPVAMGSVELAEQYGGILGVPVAFLLDREGRIRYKHTGETDAAVFEREISELLAAR
jgi:peroxiredoxin